MCKLLYNRENRTARTRSGANHAIRRQKDRVSHYLNASTDMDGWFWRSCNCLLTVWSQAVMALHDWSAWPSVARLFRHSCLWFTAVNQRLNRYGWLVFTFVWLFVDKVIAGSDCTSCLVSFFRQWLHFNVSWSQAVIAFHWNYDDGDDDNDDDDDADDDDGWWWGWWMLMDIRW